MRTISECNLSSKSKISELETENKSLKESLATLQNKDQTYELRIEHERNHAKKQNDVLKERYEKQLKTQTEALNRAEERIRALESNSNHKRRSSHNRGRGRNLSQGIIHTNGNLNINNLAVKTNNNLSVQNTKQNSGPKTPEGYFPNIPARNPSFTNLKDTTLQRRPSGIPIPTRSPTPIITPNKSSFSSPGSGNSTLVSSTHSVFSKRSGKSDGSITPVESPGETMSPPDSPINSIRIKESNPPLMREPLLNGGMKVEGKEKERTIKPTWAKMMRGNASKT